MKVNFTYEGKEYSSYKELAKSYGLKLGSLTAYISKYGLYEGIEKARQIKPYNSQKNQFDEPAYGRTMNRPLIGYDWDYSYNCF